MFGSLAIAQSAEGSWTFKRTGFLNPQVTVRVAGSDAEIATFKPSWKGDGRVKMADGRRYRFVKLSFWSSEWAFDTDDGARIVHFQPKFALLKQATDVTVGAGGQVPELAMLTLLGWYLIVLMANDAGGAAPAAAAG